MKNKRFLTGIVSILFLCLTFSQAAGIGRLDEIVARLQDNYRVMRDYEASFEQETRIKAYPRAQKSSGKVFYKKPGGMRWNYERPEASEIVTNGQTVWMYTPSLNQVMKTRFSESSQSRVATAFLSGMGNLKADFDVALDTAEEDEAGYRLVLRPKDKGDSVRTLVFTVDRETFNIKKSVLTDHYDNVTTVRLSDFKINNGLEDALFEFVPPEGVEVVTPPAMP